VAKVKSFLSLVIIIFRGDHVEFVERLSFLIGDDRGAVSRLAEAVGASTGLVSAWKAGDKKPSFEYIPKIAEYFSVTTDYLLCVSKESKRSWQSLDDNEALLLRLFCALPDDLQKGRVIGYAEAVLAALPRSESKGG